MLYLIKLGASNEVAESISIGDFSKLPLNKPLDASYMLATYDVPLGHTYEGGAYVAPPRRRWVTVRGFRERFTQAENHRAEMFILAGTQAGATQQQLQIAGSIAALNRMLSDSAYVDLDYPLTRAGVGQLDLIPGFFDAPGRVDEILDGEILPGQYHPDA